MKASKQILGKVLFSVIGLGSLVVLSACGQPNADTTNTAPAGESPTAEAPATAESPVAASPTAESPSATTSPTATAENQNIVEVASSQGSFTTFTKAVEAAGLKETLTGEGPYTVFAPTDEAFAALPTGTLDNLLKPENKQSLVKVLTYHVVPGEVTANTIQPGEVATVEGSRVNVKVDTTSKTVTVNDAKVIQPDVQASNGVIHVVDKVIPPNAASQS